MNKHKLLIHLKVHCNRMKKSSPIDIYFTVYCNKKTKIMKLNKYIYFSFAKTDT